MYNIMWDGDENIICSVETVFFFLQVQPIKITDQNR